MARMSRRNFLKITAGIGAAGSLLPLRGLFARSSLASLAPAPAAGPGRKPLVISTWSHGLPANEAAWKILSSGGASLDAVEAGVRVPEGDPSVTSVGYGGLPDEECRVTLDASIMGPDSSVTTIWTECSEWSICETTGTMAEILPPLAVEGQEKTDM